MPTPRLDWPRSAAAQRRQLTGNFIKLQRWLKTGSELKHPFQSDIYDLLGQIDLILTELDNIKQVDSEEQGRVGVRVWPLWVSQGMKDAPHILNEIREMLQEVDDTPTLFINRTVETNYEEGARMAQRLVDWITEKKDIF